MPPRKKQKTGEDLNATTQEHDEAQQEEQLEAESSTAQENASDDESSDDDGPGPKLRNVQAPLLYPEPN